MIVLLLAACLPDDWDGYHTDTDVVDTDVDTDTSDIVTGSGGQDPALARTWVSEGADLSDLFAGAGITRVDAIFRANGTYTVTSRDASGQQGVFTGTYTVNLGATPHDIELYQDSPYTAESVGIYRINNDTLTYEAVQTLPDYGNEPPDGAFGTSSGPGINSGENVQTYRVVP